jgi:hypothetical protein
MFREPNASGPAPANGVNVGDEMVLLTAICRQCGKVAEVGYIHGRARVTVTAYRCEHCGAEDALKPPAASPIAQKGPKSSLRRRRSSEHATRG